MAIYTWFIHSKWWFSSQLWKLSIKNGDFPLNMVIFLIIPYLFNYVNVYQRARGYHSESHDQQKPPRRQRAARDQKTLAHSWAPNLGSVDRGAVVKSEAKTPSHSGNVTISDDYIREKHQVIKHHLKFPVTKCDDFTIVLATGHFRWFYDDDLLHSELVYWWSKDMNTVCEWTITLWFS